MKTIFALVRILGNELPPRDLPGGRLATLAQLLREPPLSSCVKFWLINRVWDPELAAAYRKLLAGYARLGRVHEILFKPDHYFEADKLGQRLLYCPGVNQARNEAMGIAFGYYNARFAAVLDGDCGFTSNQWKDISSEIFDDYINGTGRPAYSVPSLRVDHETWDAALNDQIVDSKRQEPMLILSRNAWNQGLRYDESLAFGQSDKVELLLRLGHHGGHERQHEVVRDDQCRSVGACCHINTGPAAVESDVAYRISARHEALKRLHADIVRCYPR